MPSYLRPGLTAAAASEICMRQCRAQCCRGPLVLRLTPQEVVDLEGLAGALGVEAAITPDAGGGGQVRFLDHAGEHCPFLDNATSACRIYPQRPRRCRDFPQGPTPGCAISGGA